MLFSFAVDSEVGSEPAQCIRSGAEAETDLMKNKKVLKAVGNLSIDLIKAVVQAVVSGAVSGAMWNQRRISFNKNPFVVLMFKKLIN